MFFRFKNLVIKLLFGVLVAGSGSYLPGQVLTPPESLESNVEPIQFNGTVIQRKKYSFHVKTESGDYQVILTPKAVVNLRMNKPNYDFADRKVKVVPMEPVGTGQVPTKQTQASRVIYELPEVLYLACRFEHAGQMKRVMGAKVKRINNYILSSIDPGSQLPTNEEMVLRGMLSPGTEPSQAKLTVDDNQFDVMLGHRGATMSGFTIVDLHPNTTEVFVTGEKNQRNVVFATKVEFRPIAAESSEPSARDVSTDDGG